MVIFFCTCVICVTLTITIENYFDYKINMEELKTRGNDDKV